MNTALWIAKIILALLMASAAIIKFMPVSKMAPKMPWIGQVPTVRVRLLGVLDIMALLGLIIPMFAVIAFNLTFWTAVGIATLMISAILFHISRGEQKDIGFNLVVLLLAVFVAWGSY